MTINDSLFELLPVMGFLLALPTGTYLLAMRKWGTERTMQVGHGKTFNNKDAVELRNAIWLKSIHAHHVVDLILAVSLVYVGFYGLFVSVNTNETDVQQPVLCLYTALHLHLWCIVDTASISLLLLSAFDQLLPVIWTRHYLDFASICYNPLFLAISLGAICTLTLIPAWRSPLRMAGNSTVTVSPFCPMHEVFGEEFYAWQLRARMWLPTVAVCILLLATLCLLAVQIKWSFKWPEYRSDSWKFFHFTLVRCILLAAGVHLPQLAQQLRHPSHSYFFTAPHHLSTSAREFPHQATECELSIRIITTLLLMLVQPAFSLLLVPGYGQRLLDFFTPHNSERSWQGVNDPPRERIGRKGEQRPPFDFGSWYSTAGNIVGEAGIPYAFELDADVQRSISFFY